MQYMFFKLLRSTKTLGVGTTAEVTGRYMQRSSKTYVGPQRKLCNITLLRSTKTLGVGTDMEYMFYSASAFNQDIRDWNGGK